MRVCSVDECDKPILNIKRGLCKLHADRWHRNKSFESSINRKPDPICTFDGCDKQHAGRGLCNGHFAQQARGQELFSLRPLRSSHGNTRKGGPPSRTYSSWQHMKNRCYNPNETKSYPNYGGRGIVVCGRWKDSFPSFLEDMSERPNDMSIDRIDPDGNYSCGKCEECIENGWPKNCRWATSTEQNLNRRNNKKRKEGNMNLIENIDKEIKKAKAEVKALNAHIKALEQARAALSGLKRKKTTRSVKAAKKLVAVADEPVAQYE